MADSKRMSRVNSEIQKCMASLISRLDDSEIASSMISILKVETFADFSLAKIYVSVLGDEFKQQHIVAKLNDNKKSLRYDLAHKIRFRVVPDLLFIVDNTYEKQQKVLKLFEQIEAEGNISGDNGGKEE